MDLLKIFSADYANAVTAITALGAVLLAGVTLWFLKREYSAKYRPYVVPVVDAEKIQDSLGCWQALSQETLAPTHVCLNLPKFEYMSVMKPTKHQI